MTVIFFVSLSTLIYIYVGYPLLVWALAKLFGHDPARGTILPTVSLVIPAYNEQAYIEHKLRNSLGLDYPRDRLEIIVASDGSTDGTNAIVERFQSTRVRLLAMDHVGKSPMLAHVVPQLHSEVVVFSDASSELAPDALRELVGHFADPRVACVSGVYRLKRVADLRAQGEGLYWRYETFLKTQESRLHSILGAHGAFYGIRTSLFRGLDDTSINDDYLVPMHAVAQGYRAVYEPRAVAWEHDLATLHGEFTRRRRIAAGNCQQIVRLRQLLHPRYGWIALCFFSHKVLRTVAPILLLLLLAASFWLAQPWAMILVAIQGVLYLSAYAGYVCQRRGRVVTWLSPPLYFCLGNLAMLVGTVRFLVNRRRCAWERAR